MKWKKKLKKSSTLIYITSIWFISQGMLWLKKMIEKEQVWIKTLQNVRNLTTVFKRQKNGDKEKQTEESTCTHA